MHATGLVASSGRLRAAAGFVTAVLRAVTWRSVIATQALALLIALFTWLETSGWSCLLYTSPSPRDPKTSRMPSSA